MEHWNIGQLRECGPLFHCSIFFRYAGSIRHCKNNKEYVPLRYAPRLSAPLIRAVSILDRLQATFVDARSEAPRSIWLLFLPATLLFRCPLATTCLPSRPSGLLERRFEPLCAETEPCVYHARVVIDVALRQLARQFRASVERDIGKSLLQIFCACLAGKSIDNRSRVSFPRSGAFCYILCSQLCEPVAVFFEIHISPLRKEVILRMRNCKDKTQDPES